MLRRYIAVGGDEQTNFGSRFTIYMIPTTYKIWQESFRQCRRLSNKTQAETGDLSFRTLWVTKRRPMDLISDYNTFLAYTREVKDIAIKV